MSFPAARLKPWAYPLLLTAFALLIAAFIHKTRGFGFAMPQFILPAIEFGEQHRIQSDFFPVGYTGFLGLGMMLTHADGISLVNVVIFVSLVLFCYLFLLMRGLAARDASLIALVVALFPSVSASIFNVADTIFIAMFLFAILAMTLAVARQPQQRFFDAALAIILGCALSTRLNLVLILPVIWLLWKRYGVPRLVPRIGLQVLLAVGTYMAIGAAVHGEVFVPRYGAYNLFASANAYTSGYLSEEDSIWVALPAKGILVAMNSGCVVDYQRCFPTIYDAKLDPFYRKAALEYIREHPLQTAGRCVWRLGNFLRPDFLAHSIRSFGGMLKVMSACVVPLWLIGVAFLPCSGSQSDRLVVPLFAAAYTLPFVLLVSQPRYRIPIELVCLADLLAILLVWWRGRTSQAYAVPRER